MNPSDLQFASTPPVGWSELSEKQGCLIHSPEWHDVISGGFGAKPVYAWDKGLELAFSISVFRAGPFRIGYVGFPIGGALRGPLRPEHVERLRESRPAIDLLRIPISGFEPPIRTEFRHQSAPETAVLDLPNWCLSDFPKLRRDIKKAGRNPFNVRDVIEPAYAHALYALYRHTILSHHGRLRYNAGYFAKLLELASCTDRLRILAAFDNAELAAYVVTVLDRDVAYYLHGATHPERKASGVSDLLVYTALEWARNQGMRCFNLMSSPASQPGLIRFKEKFGGSTKLHRTYEASISPIRAGLFSATQAMYLALSGLDLRKR
ncbi:GNAT family N-acetyltransferase [Thiorhodococcus minor]|uniref:GNAT family N-acetyltransferase n=1 Tax=Thiorhodococcus minor TaxID=57489 RepID=A0A6M0K8T7_9GAMM|nr:GNAT family N-acetyltransferase [Thiorhodococcus minor]NEV64835.1 GNAT family N-acetyltransferase [Thiorhodococcus minor]